MPKANKIKRQIHHFDKIAERYFKAHQDPNHLLVKSLMWSFFFKNNEYIGKRGLTVLEPMCGYAEGKEILEQQLNLPFSYKGFDYSDSVLTKLKTLFPELNVVKQDITTYKPSAEKYDLIILIGGLHHIPHAASKVLKLLANCLKQGGWFISAEPTYGNIFIKKIRELIYRYNSLFDEETERAFSIGELISMFEQAKLTKRDMIFPELLSYIFFYNPDAFPFLNIGSERIVRAMFKFDKLFFRSRIGRILSFGTISLWQRI